jgi:hypothetical protein
MDMLRHDSCWPASSEDAAKIEWGYTQPGGKRYRSVKLRSYREPTIARWVSFQWPVGIHNLQEVKPAEMPTPAGENE